MKRIILAGLVLLTAISLFAKAEDGVILGSNDIIDAITKGIVIGDSKGFRLSDPMRRDEALFVVGNYSRYIVQPKFDELDARINAIRNNDALDGKIDVLKMTDIRIEQKIDTNADRLNETRDSIAAISKVLKKDIRDNADNADRVKVNQDCDIEALRQVNVQQDKNIAYVTDIAESRLGIVSPWSGKVYLREVADVNYRNSNVWLGAVINWQTPLILVEGLNNTKLQVSGEFAKIGGTAEDYSRMEVSIGW